MLDRGRVAHLLRGVHGGAVRKRLHRLGLQQSGLGLASGLGLKARVRAGAGQGQGWTSGLSLGPGFQALAAPARVGLRADEARVEVVAHDAPGDKLAVVSYSVVAIEHAL